MARSLFVLDIRGLPRQRLLFASVYLLAMASVALTALPWPMKAAVLVLVLLMGYLTDRVYSLRGHFLPLRLIYDDGTRRRGQWKGSNWRARGADQQWRNLELIAYFNFLDVYLLLMFRNRDAASSSKPLHRLLSIPPRRTMWCLPLLVGDVSSEQLRRLRVLARLGD